MIGLINIGIIYSNTLNTYEFNQLYNIYGCDLPLFNYGWIYDSVLIAFIGIYHFSSWSIDR